MSITALGVTWVAGAIAATKGTASINGRNSPTGSKIMKVVGGALFGLVAQWACSHISAYENADRAATNWVVAQFSSSNPHP